MNETEQTAAEETYKQREAVQRQIKNAWDAIEQETGRRVSRIRVWFDEGDSEERARVTDDPD